MKGQVGKEEKGGGADNWLVAGVNTAGFPLVLNSRVQEHYHANGEISMGKIVYQIEMGGMNALLWRFYGLFRQSAHRLLNRVVFLRHVSKYYLKNMLLDKLTLTVAPKCLK